MPLIAIIICTPLSNLTRPGAPSPLARKATWRTDLLAYPFAYYFRQLHNLFAPPQLTERPLVGSCHVIGISS